MMGDIADMMIDQMIDEVINGYDNYEEPYRGTQRIPATWKVAGGQVIQISDMTDIHLKRTISMLQRQIDGSSHDDFCWDNINAMQLELKRRNKNMDKISNVDLKVVGVTFKNADGSSRKDKILQVANNKENTIIEVVREADNKYDNNAVMVIADSTQIGYIGKDFSAILAPMMDMGRQFRANVKDCGEYKERPYCTITVNEI